MNDFIEQQRKRMDEYKKDQEIADLKEQVASLTARLVSIQMNNMTLMSAVRELAKINIKLCDKLDAHDIPVDDHKMTPSDKKFLKDMGIKDDE